jgi:isopenicillin-N N-acyltransferase like protein
MLMVSEIAVSEISAIITSRSATLKAHQEHDEFYIIGDPCPLISVDGSPFDCGVALGEIWRDTLVARSCGGKKKPWWEQSTGSLAEIVDEYAPHLRDVMKGMQKGAGLAGMHWDDAGSSDTRPTRATPDDGQAGCTAFSVAPALTMNGTPISGQTKDTARASADRYVVLRMTPKGAPAFLTLTYPGEIFGYGFSSTGMSIFRNSLYAGVAEKGLPFHLWGLAALCMKNLGEAKEVVLRHGLAMGGNALVSDEKGRAMSVESGADGTFIVEGDSLIHVHANHVNHESLCSCEDYEQDKKAISIHRQKRVAELLESDAGQVTPESCMAHLADHENFPGSVCSHLDPPRHETTAAVVAEPTRGRLHVVRGAPCRNPVSTYTL